MPVAEAFEQWCERNPLRLWRRDNAVSRSGLVFHLATSGYRVTPATLLRWERGEYSPPDRAMNALEAVTGIKDLRKQWERWQKARAAIARV